MVLIFYTNVTFNIKAKRNFAVSVSLKAKTKMHKYLLGNSAGLCLGSLVKLVPFPYTSHHSLCLLVVQMSGLVSDLPWTLLILWAKTSALHK